MRQFALTTATLLAFGMVAVTAQAATIKSASGPILVNGKQVTIDPSKPYEIPKGATVESGTATVVVVSKSGDEIALERDSILRNDGEESGVEGLFLMQGTAVAELGPNTTVGSWSSWVQVPAGQTTKSKVFIEELPSADKLTHEGTVRAISGDAWLWLYAYRIGLPVGHTISLSVDTRTRENVCFRTGQRNPGDVELQKKVTGGDIVALIPKATAGCVELVEDGKKTKISNDIASLKSGKIRLETRFGGESDQAALGPGTHALIDNLTGVIQVAFAAVQYEILERAIDLTTEFSTLAQSNFSDVGEDSQGSNNRSSSDNEER